MSFLPIPEELEGTTDINDLFAQPTSDDPDRHSDKLLQTILDSKALQKRLLTIYYDARTSLEETGINIFISRSERSNGLRRTTLLRNDTPHYF